MSPRGAKQDIVLAAERLFARHGVDGVPLRHVGVEAGSANNSAVQYHFGTKQGLVNAILAFREPGLQLRREELIGNHPPTSLREWVECQVRVVMEQAEQPGSRYIGFIYMNRSTIQILDGLPADLRNAVEAFHARLPGLLDELPEPLRSHRIAQCQSFILSAAADRERAIEQDQSVLPFEIEVADLVDSLVGFLGAPMSAAMTTALGRLKSTTPRPSLVI